MKNVPKGDLDPHKRKIEFLKKGTLFLTFGVEMCVGTKSGSGLVR